ncbi:MAG: hypothetical protein LBT04_00230 [Prevotellaceae bacterium]|jgi:hypothetical protein|nr:hypothetical protein [Prevotellaceae bacterium]
MIKSNVYKPLRGWASPNDRITGCICFAAVAARATAGTLCAIKTRNFLKMEGGGIRAAATEPKIFWKIKVFCKIKHNY